MVAFSVITKTFAFISGLEVDGRSPCFKPTRSIIAGASGAASAWAEGIILEDSGDTKVPATNAAATVRTMPV
jgi:hypothetical protein